MGLQCIFFKFVKYFLLNAFATLRNRSLFRSGHSPLWAVYRSSHWLSQCFCIVGVPRENIGNTGGYPFFNQKKCSLPYPTVFHLHVRMCLNLTLSPCVCEWMFAALFLNVVFLRMQAASVVAVGVPSWNKKTNHISYSAQKILWNKLCLDHVCCVKYFSTTHQFL